MPSAVPQHATCFGKFRQLPIELRLMIWEYSLPDPRLIHILGSSTSFEFGTGGTVRCTYRIPTTLLHTSREARDIALRYYKFVFSSSLQGGDKPVWVDYERDTICFGDYKLLADFFGLVGQYTEVDHDLTSSSLDCLESIRHVAVGGLVTVHEVDLLGELAALESLTLLEMDEYRRTRECFSWRRFGKKFEKAMYEEWEQRGRRAQLPELFFLEKTEFEKRFEPWTSEKVHESIASILGSSTSADHVSCSFLGLDNLFAQWLSIIF